MDKKQVTKTLKLVKENSNKRNFKQTIDLIVNLRDIDLKKQQNRFDIYSQLHYDRGKEVKICGLVGTELAPSAKENFTTTIMSDDFKKHTDKKMLKRLVKDHLYFVAQANIMPQVAQNFGKVLGPSGKMPNPKAGCVVPPNANLAAVKERLSKTVRIKIEDNPVYQVAVGVEDMDDEKIVDNIMTIYNSLIHALPNESHNIKNVYLKLTMGKAHKVGDEGSPIDKKKRKKKEIGSASHETKNGNQVDDDKSTDKPKEQDLNLDKSPGGA